MEGEGSGEYRRGGRKGGRGEEEGREGEGIE